MKKINLEEILKEEEFKERLLRKALIRYTNRLLLAAVGFVTKEDFGGWPFTVGKGIVYSIDGAAVFVAEHPDYGETSFQLNGAATTHPYTKDFKPLDLIWRDNPDIPGTKMNIEPFIRLALENRDKP